MDHDASEFWSFENFEGHYDVISGGQTKKSFLFDLRLRLELMLDGYSTDFRTEKIFQENGRLRVVCHHLGCDTTPGGFMRGAQKWGKILARAFFALTPFCAVTYANFNLQSISRNKEPFFFRSCGESSLIFQLRPIFTPKKSCSFS